MHAWLPDAPGRVSEIRFAHSPGRLDPEWLNSLRAFDAAFVLDRGDGTQGIVGGRREVPRAAQGRDSEPENLWRYREVHEHSGAFDTAAFDAFKGRSDLVAPLARAPPAVSMLQHPSGAWTWGRYLFVIRSGNVDMADADARYRSQLADDSTFSSMTLEALLAAKVLPRATTAALRDRYL